MNNYDLENQIEGLKRNEQIVVTKTQNESKPQFLTIGNGVSNSKFPADVVMDALKVFASLTPAQQEIVIGLRNKMIQNQTRAYYAKAELTNPNEVQLSHTTIEGDDEQLKTLIGQNRNGSILKDRKVMRKKNKHTYMLNPFMFIPPYRFAETRQEWDRLEPNTED